MNGINNENGSAQADAVSRVLLERVARATEDDGALLYSKCLVFFGFRVVFGLGWVGLYWGGDKLGSNPLPVRSSPTSHSLLRRLF
jgi:hypothetical protein